MMETEESPAARRRKRILNRSSERMSIITKSFNQSSDPESSSSVVVFPRTKSAPTWVIEADRFSEYGSDEISRLPFNYGSTDGGDRITSLQFTKANVESEQDSDAPCYGEVKEPTPNDDRISKASNKRQMYPKSVRNQLSSYFTAKDINSCIISSENTRRLCAIMIAILVVIAYANLPRHVVRSESIIASRPLYMLLVTDFTIVIFRQCFTKKNTPEVEMGKPESGQEIGSNLDNSIKVLEWGLVLYQMLCAILIDCSFFTVIVVCGCSLL